MPAKESQAETGRSKAKFKGMQYARVIIATMQKEWKILCSSEKSE